MKRFSSLPARRHVLTAAASLKASTATADETSADDYPKGPGCALVLGPIDFESGGNTISSYECFGDALADEVFSIPLFSRPAYLLNSNRVKGRSRPDAGLDLERRDLECQLIGTTVRRARARPGMSPSPAPAIR